jgi:two-component system NtrC family sensor kinase
MLQHARPSSGSKELTDVNMLCTEFLTLAYQGFRARDKSFNAVIQTDFNSGLERISINPQDIARVILNLLNNAFYAVDEKKKKHDETFEPTVFVSTHNEAGKVIISIRDNGNGIPKKILDKIFNPFFTTKPSGRGTGLGLSLSYDIMKAAGGELKVESQEGNYAEFSILLPNIK